MSKNFELMLKSEPRELLLASESPKPSRLRRTRPEACDDHEILPLVRSLFASEARRVRSVMFASVEPSGQSASVLVRVARAVASSQAVTVCMVDANPSHPSMHRTLAARQPDTPDLPDDPTGRFTTYEVEPGLWFLPSAQHGAEPGDDFALDDTPELTRQLRESFDVVLADIGPIGQASAMATRGADGLVLVVTANATRRAAALKAAREFVAAGGRLLGTVLTERSFPIPEAIYRRL
jgi:Mrp family chromosome partitioning ATPase